LSFPETCWESGQHFLENNVPISQILHLECNRNKNQATYRTSRIPGNKSQLGTRDSGLRGLAVHQIPFNLGDHKVHVSGKRILIRHRVARHQHKIISNKVLSINVSEWE
jgi:hypothetical protein